jgi:hypothetical protein
VSGRYTPERIQNHGLNVEITVHSSPWNHTFLLQIIIPMNKCYTTTGISFLIKRLGAVWIFSFWRNWNLRNGLCYWLGVWYSITFPSSQISLSQIHRVWDGNGFYRSLCYNSILQLIAHSSTHFFTIEMQHISMSFICLTINIQIYSIYNYISLINLCLNYNY